MIDLHSHLLPGVDDGSRSVTQSRAVLRRMADEGITAVCLTPHFPASRAEQGIPAGHDRAYEALSGSGPLPVALHRGVELMLDRPFPAGAVRDRRLTLGGSRYLLVEFPPQVTAGAARAALGNIAEQGLVPLLAHPERYLCASPAVVAEWRAAGARMQVDATTLFMPRSRGNRARALLAEGLADVLASDNHGDRRLLSLARAALEEQGAGEQAELLTRGNPSAILENSDTAPVEPIVLRQSVLQKLRQLFQPED